MISSVLPQVFLWKQFPVCKLHITHATERIVSFYHGPPLIQRYHATTITPSRFQVVYTPSRSHVEKSKCGGLNDTCLSWAFKLLKSKTKFAWLIYFFMFTSTHTLYLTLPVLYILENCIEIKINLKLLFSHFFVVLKKFYEGLYKTFWGTTKNVKIKI